MIKKYFIPHEANEYKPHFFREASMLFVSFALVGAFVSTMLHRYVIEHTDLLADVVPKAIVELANYERAVQSLHSLAYSPALEAAARQKAADMALKGYFSHESPEGLTPWYWFKAAGYDFSYAGENLAVDFSDSVDVDRAWMNSPRHRANILNSNFTEIGVAMAKGNFEGRETTFVVQMFGRPALNEPITASHAPRPTDAGAPTAMLVPPDTQVSDSVLAASLPTVTEEIQKQDEMFIAFEDGGLSTDSNAAVPLGTTQEASLRTKLFSSPSRNLSLLYRAVGLLVALSLVLMVLIEIRIQHPRNIAYGLGVLALLFILILAYNLFFVAHVVVV